MQKDMKIGMFVGLILAAAVMVYVCTRPDLSPRARMLRQNNGLVQSQPHQLSATSLSLDSNMDQTSVPTPQEQQITEAVQIESQPVNESPGETVYVETVYETRKFYIVRKGDSLSKISRIYYGSANKWYKIYEANRDVLENPDMLKPGTKLHIPN